MFNGKPTTSLAPESSFQLTPLLDTLPEALLVLDANETIIARASTGETVRFDALIHPREGVYRDLDATIIPHVDGDHHIDYLGITVEHMQSDRWAPLPFIYPDDRDGTRTLWQHALETGVMYEHEERFRNGQTGAYRWFLVRAMPVRDETGQIVNNEA